MDFLHCFFQDLSGLHYSVVKSICFALITNPGIGKRGKCDVFERSSWSSSLQPVGEFLNFVGNAF